MTVPCNYDPYEGRYDGFLGELRLPGRAMLRGLPPYPVVYLRCDECDKVGPRRIVRHQGSFTRRGHLSMPAEYECSLCGAWARAFPTTGSTPMTRRRPPSAAGVQPSSTPCCSGGVPDALPRSRRRRADRVPCMRPLGTIRSVVTGGSATLGQARSGYAAGSHLRRSRSRARSGSGGMNPAGTGTLSGSPSPLMAIAAWKTSWPGNSADGSIHPIKSSARRTIARSCGSPVTTNPRPGHAFAGDPIMSPSWSASRGVMSTMP